MEKVIIDDIVDWIGNYVNNAGANGVVIGMSGGKDSLVTAKLCTMAVGKCNVFGLIMPNQTMNDIDDAIKACDILKIPYKVLDISETYESIISNVNEVLNNKKLSTVTTINISPRIRMTMLYAVAGTLNYLVVNTSNLSETMIGYCTKWGDNTGDFAPLADFTKTEVCEIGLMLGLPEQLVKKSPSDGLTGKSDEDNIGFSYDELDKFIRFGEKGTNYDKILSMSEKSKHKRKNISKFISGFNNFLNDN